MARRALSVSAVLVHYRTPGLLGPAIEALSRSADRAGVGLDCVVIDNGSDPEDAATLGGLPARLVSPGRNLGYAGGVNLGVAKTAGDVVVLLNPDVVLDAECLRTLLPVLDSGAAVAAPRCYLDHGRQWLQPPTEVRSRRAELASTLAAGGLARGAVRRAWRRHAHRQWTARAAVRSHELSGAVLALKRDAWMRVGPFDEGYRLYFEETDWLLRLRRAGLDAFLVPDAVAVHLHAQSAVQEPRAADWFAASHRRFRRRWYGPVFTAFLERLARLLPRRPLGPPVRPPGDLGRGGWLELSASAHGFPATARRRDADATESVDDCLDALRTQLPAGRYALRGVTAAGRESADMPIALP